MYFFSLFLFCIPELCANPSSEVSCSIKKKINSFIGQRSLIRYSYLLRAGRFGDRIPVGTRFSAPVQTSTETHPASYTMDTGSFPGVKRAGRGVDHPPHLAPRLKKEYNYTSIPLMGLRSLF